MDGSSADAQETSRDTMVGMAQSGSFTLLRHQVAGHLPILSHRGKIFKPAWPNETNFYLNIDQRCSRMRPFIPAFFSLAELVPPTGTDSADASDGSDDAASSGDGQRRSWGQKCRSRNKDKIESLRNQYLILEDLTSAFSRPSVLDLKIGTRQHGMDASAEKARRQTQKCKETTSFSTGLRLCGMQIYQPENESFIYRDKYYGRSLTFELLYAAVKSFFYNGQFYRADCLRECVERTARLREAATQSKNMRFYSSSMLVIYEGSEQMVSQVDVRVIDFAHCHHVSDNSLDDSGFIFGLDMFLRLLQTILAEVDSATPFVPRVDRNPIPATVDVPQ